MADPRTPGADADATVVRPAQPRAAESAPPRRVRPASATRFPDVEADAAAEAALATTGSNALLRASAALLFIAVQLRQSAANDDARRLREQCIAHVARFESLAAKAGVDTKTVMAARYVLCTMIDEAVLTTPWGEPQGWAQQTLLVRFHGETYGGDKFFEILDRLCRDVPRHIDLIEVMYLCMALGFGGKYLVEPGGSARLAARQTDVYRRILSERGTAPQQLSPHWRGLDGGGARRRAGLLPALLLAAACVLLGTFLFFHARLNALSAPVSAVLARVGAETVLPPAATVGPRKPRASLKQLLQPQEQAGLLDVDERADGVSTVRIAAVGMFPSGGTEVDASQRPLLQRIAWALDQVDGRVLVTGHTDDQPVRSLRLKDNFELSRLRALSVQALLGAGLVDPRRIEATGAGDSQPLATPTQSPQNRARNRRVEITLIPEN